jgi:hypothetical protein
MLNTNMIIWGYRVHADDACIESGSILTVVDIIHEQNQWGRTRVIFVASLWQKVVTACLEKLVTP